ncbi:MAG: hypothetical protein IKM33_01975, partial [Clostridia bacterium]|nr:hypothetical protein [Clostridia bacterium]
NTLCGQEIFKVTNCRNLPLDWLLRSKRLHPFCILHFAFSNSPINPNLPIRNEFLIESPKFPCIIPENVV